MIPTIMESLKKEIYIYLFFFRVDPQQWQRDSRDKIPLFNFVFPGSSTICTDR